MLVSDTVHWSETCLIVKKGTGSLLAKCQESYQPEQFPGEFLKKMLNLARGLVKWICSNKHKQPKEIRHDRK
jgi:hypothetical protein